MSDIERNHGNNENESFSTTLTRLLEEHIEEEDYGWLDYIFTDIEATDKYNKILEAFELYGSFLDCIPLEDREVIINGSVPDQKGIISGTLIREILRYSQLPLQKEMKEIYPSRDSQRLIKKTMNVINKFEELVDEIVYNSMEGRYPVKNYAHLLLALETTQCLKEDLDKKEFKIFSKTDYYAWEVPTKKNLKNILNDLIYKYNIKGASIDKKALIDYF